ncbi:MAG TPA: hypothetical protein VNL13_09670 [Sulfolobales archaeon]|nr:hypothetical protein [Sulfolobales archaeon]
MGVVSRNHPESMEAEDMGSDERSSEAEEAKGRAICIKIPAAMKPELLFLTIPTRSSLNSYIGSYPIPLNQNPWLIPQQLGKSDFTNQARDPTQDPIPILLIVLEF